MPAFVDEVVPHHIVRGVAGQVDDRGLEVRDLRQSSAGNLLEPCARQFVQSGVVPDERCVHDSRGDAVHVQASTSPLASQGLEGEGERRRKVRLRLRLGGQIVELQLPGP